MTYFCFVVRAEDNGYNHTSQNNNFASKKSIVLYTANAWKISFTNSVNEEMTHFLSKQ